MGIKHILQEIDKANIRLNNEQFIAIYNTLQTRDYISGLITDDIIISGIKIAFASN